MTDNLAVTPADYTPYCITAPKNPRLPGGGGYPLCNLADINANKFGPIQNYITAASKFGTFSTRNDFVGVTLDARLLHCIRLNGGFDTGRSVQDRCFVVDSPQELLNCRVVTPFSAQRQFKANGVFPL